MCGHPQIPWCWGFWWPKELSRHGHNQHICITYNDVMILTHTKTAAMLLRHHPTHHIRPQMACMPHYTSTIANIRCSMQQVGTCMTISSAIPSIHIRIILIRSRQSHSSMSHHLNREARTSSPMMSRMRSCSALSFVAVVYE